MVEIVGEDILLPTLAPPSCAAVRWAFVRADWDRDKAALKSVVVDEEADEVDPRETIEDVYVDEEAKLP